MMAADDAAIGDNVTRRSVLQLTGTAFAFFPASSGAAHQPATGSPIDTRFGAMATAESRANLASKDPGATGGVFLAEPSREGTFAFSRMNLAAKVSADLAQGIYIAPDSDPSGASGAWVRRINGPIDPRWFGVVEGAGKGSANSAALNSMLKILRARAVNASTNYRGLEAVRFPAGLFEFATTIDLTDGTVILEGADTGFAGGRGTILKFPSGITGIRIQRYNTSGVATTDSPTHRGGDGAIIRNLALRGAYTGAEVEAHGIQLRARAHIENVYIEEFEGDGIHGAASAGGAREGNANNSRILGVRIQECRRGIFIDGADANIWTIIAADTSSNRQWGIEDSSFLGNSYFGCHCAANGNTSAGAAIAPTVVSHRGNRYGVIAGQEAGASANAPSGSTANNAWWYYISAGGVMTGIPAWSRGTNYRAGGSYRTDNKNARNIFVGCYHESGQGKPQLVSPTLVVGGMLSGNPYGTAGEIGVEDNAVKVNSIQAKHTTSSGNVVKARLGEDNPNYSTILYAYDSVVAPGGWRLKFSGANLRLDYANGASAVAFHVTGPTATDHFGTGSAVPNALYPPKLMVGDSIGNARQISNGTAAPTSGAHGQGEIVWNRTPASGQPMGWICSVAGTPGTWLPLANVT